MNPRNRFENFLHTGLLGLGVFVLLVSVTQGVSGIIGALLLMIISSLAWTLLAWFSRRLEALVRRS
jgi:Zn-dependent protease with chaperone function